MARASNIIPGLLYVLPLSVLAAWLGSLMPIVGSPLFGLLLGILLNNLIGKPARTIVGIQFSAKQILQWAIIAIGCGLSLTNVWMTGMDSLAVLLASLLAAFCAAQFFGRWLRIPDRLKVLIGVGTGICGGSAISAAAPIIEAKEDEIAYAVSTIFLFNLAGALFFPILGHVFGLSDLGFGLWAGTAINDTSSVIVAGYLFSETAGDYATIVKLVRTTFIIPVTIILAAYMLRKKRDLPRPEESEGGNRSPLHGFPWFILWFLCASLLNTLGFFGEEALNSIGTAAKFMVVMALTAIGLSSNIRAMMRTGVRPILFGLIVWFFVAAASLGAQWLTGQW
ncbi:YeiH family protein [Paenibacillaceae bacterium WGS1546]|uniref:YeiH family protein n=1 Tax=Cohnella sp. WGS1546 TaxID=3366810 RepID=UPI00372CED28